MALTFQECINTLLAGDKLSWAAHDNHSGGGISLDTSSSRRLLEYLLTQSTEMVAGGNESLFNGLIEAWENEKHDPKSAQTGKTVTTEVGGFRLAHIETEGFGGLNLFGGQPFTLTINRQSWCLEGQNGSGKTSLISAIIWALTGRRIREHSGPITDKGLREPVYDSKGKKIGTWPPLASYPTHVADLVQDAKTRVKLVFMDGDGNEATAERSIISKADGAIETVIQKIDARLLVAPQLVDVGILMPSRLAHLNFGEKSQTLYQAVKMLTGLDQLGAIGDGAAVLTHGGRKFLKYAKDKGISRIETDYSKRIATANEHAKGIGLDLALIQAIDGKDVQGELTKLIDMISTKAGEHADILNSEVSEDTDLSKVRGRQKVIEAVGEARAVAKSASSDVRTFSVLKGLYEAKADGKLKTLSTAIALAEEKLATALKWHASQQEDKKLRLKALASKWYEIPENPEDPSFCPLCISELSTPEQKELAAKLEALKAAGEDVERRLEDVCLNVREDLMKAFPETLRPHLDFLGNLDPKSEIVAAATSIFTVKPPFANTLTGTAIVMGMNISANTEKLSVFVPTVTPTTGEGEHESLLPVRKAIFSIRRTLELSEWWGKHREEFVGFWKQLIGFAPDGEDPKLDTLMGQISKIEKALAASQPFDAIIKELKEVETLVRDWRQIREEQERREAIAKALSPFKDFRTLVDTETARSIATLSERIKEILERIHIKERFDFHDADLKKKEVHVHGTFTEEMKVDALPIANTSWLRAILWAFIHALREQTVEMLGGNPFPLTLLDDPQTTFDPRNKRRWAKELSRLAGLAENDHHNAQIFLTTHEREFFTLVTEVERLNGQEGLIAPADDTSGCITIINGNVLERIYREAEENNDDARAREFIRQTRIYVEKLLKHMLRGEGPDISGSNLDKLRNEIIRLRKNHTAPFTRRPFDELLNVLGGSGRGIILINEPSHNDNESIGLAEAKDVLEYWETHLKKKIHKAFHAYAAFEAHQGDPRTFDYPEHVVALPTGQKNEVRKAELFCTGIAAAAKTDGRIGDGLLHIEEWKTAEKVVLQNHEIYRLTAGTLEPIASIGDFIIVSNYAKVGPRDLVAAAVGKRLLARRFNTSEAHPDLSILTAQAVDPYDIAEPQLVPLEGLELRRIVGTLFSSMSGSTEMVDELAVVADSSEYLRLLDQSRLFKVQGRSAEPIALDGQSLIVGNPVDDVSQWANLDGRLVIAIDADGASYFKRFRLIQSGIFVLESLNPDGTTSAELLSADGRNGIPQLAHLLPVLGVLFELPDHT